MKRSVFLQLVLPIVLVILSFSSGVMAKEKILWVKWKLVPEYIEDGEFANQGYLDKFLADTIKRFPEYAHSTEFQSISRLDRSWDSGNVCTVHLWLGYWPDKILYSKPYGFTPRFGIVTQRDSELAKRYADKESVSLKALLDDTDFQVGMLPLMIQGTDNSRYPQLKSTLLARMNNGNIKEFSNSRNEMSVEYLDRGRVDYIIRQRITHYTELKIKKRPDQYRFYYLDEGMTYKQVAAACSNTKLGRTVIEKFNSLMGDELFEAYLNYRQEWDTDNKVYEKVYRDYFIHNQPNPFVVE